MTPDVTVVLAATSMIGALIVTAVYVGRKFGAIEQQLVDVDRRLEHIEYALQRMGFSPGGAAREP